MSDEVRSRAARSAAETALVRIIHHYGETPEFVLLGGLVPELLCVGAGVTHAGTTDVDVQVDLELAGGTVNVVRLERALLNAEFEPDEEKRWRWRTFDDGIAAEIKFELLADQDTVQNQHTLHFDGCQKLAAVNLRGTGFAARDYAPQTLTAKIGGVVLTADVNVTGLAGFLMAKTAAAHGRHKEKDYYDIAFVLLHNAAGGIDAAVGKVTELFGAEIVGAMRSAFLDLAAHFDGPQAMGSRAFAAQMCIDHPEMNSDELAADAAVAGQRLCRAALG